MGARSPASGHTQDMLLHVGLASAPVAHAHSAAFFKSKVAMAFIVSRLYAW